MNGNVDRYEMLPIIIQDTDVEIFEKIRKFQKKKPQEKIKFETDDQSAAYEVFRIGPDPISGITPAPTSYEDFKENWIFRNLIFFRLYLFRIWPFPFVGIGLFFSNNWYNLHYCRVIR